MLLLCKIPAKYLNAFYNESYLAKRKEKKNQSKTCGLKSHRLDPGLTIVIIYNKEGGMTD